jgi:iron complex outermembrane recepter protein
VTLDYWKIDRKNEIVQADPASILGSASVSGGPTDLVPVPGAIPNSFLYYDAAGQLQAVSAPNTNASSTKTDGVDLELRHRMNLGDAGKLTAQLNWTHVNKFRRTDAFGNTVDYTGTHGPIVQSSGAGTPKDRASMALTFERGPWAVTGMVNYVGPLKLVDHKGEVAPCDSTNPDGSCEAGTTVTDTSNAVTWNWDGTSSRECGAFTLTGQPYNGCKLPSFTTFDLYARWTPIKNLDLNFSIQNLFDRKAPFDAYAVLSYGINYNQGWHQAGAVGRFFTIGAKYSF